MNDCILKELQKIFSGINYYEKSKHDGRISIGYNGIKIAIITKDDQAMVENNCDKSTTTH